MQGYKTIIVSVIIAVAGVLQATDWATVIPSGKWAGVELLAIGAIMAALRYVTTSPIFNPDQGVHK